MGGQGRRRRRPRAAGDGRVERFRAAARDDTALRTRLAAWLTARVGSPVAVTTVERPSGNGLSSETVLFDAEWGPGGPDTSGGGAFVARLAPEPGAFPVFPLYDLGAQVRAIRLVAERTAVPVPNVRWYEADAGPLGTPLFVMDRVAGRVPPDVMPYPMGSWVSEATDDERAAMQDATVAQVAAVHAVEATPTELAFLDPGGAGDTPLRRHVAAERGYLAWAVPGGMPLLERAFRWLDDHWPEAADRRPPTLCWGDARIGNVVYDGFTPVALLDWEMATYGPPELDVGWTVFLHRFFQDLCEDLGLPGLPTFLARDDVVESYVRHGGREPEDLDWFITYAAVRHGTVMARVLGRQVQMGERPPPGDPEELVLHRHSLARLLDGTYWP